MFLVMLVGSMMVLIFMLCIHMDVSFSRNANGGLFGWMNAEENRIYILLHIAVVCNVVGTMVRRWYPSVEMAMVCEVKQPYDTVPSTSRVWYGTIPSIDIDQLTREHGCLRQGFVRAMMYFDTIIIAVATLLEPMIATLIAFAIGVGNLPGALGWLGNLLVVLGTLGVVYPSLDKPLEH